MINPLPTIKLDVSKDCRRLRGKDVQLGSQPNVSRGITAPTEAVGAELVSKFPVTTETALVLKTSGGRVTRHREVAMGAGIGQAILLIVAKKMAMKALSKRASRAEGFWPGKNMSGRGQDLSPIGELDMFCGIVRDGKGLVVWFRATVRVY